MIIRDARTGEELRSFLLLTKGLNRLKADTKSVYETGSDSLSAQSSLSIKGNSLKPRPSVTSPSSPHPTCR
ncbi:hypothetical protein C4J95_2480 [Pseudomonas orientalis]|nr:hypothetical protein C4J96_2379 [Pseudomonas orientalis]AZE99942.1 hypothetical protein C4J95_2480 [Pseudomonas orientalis]